MTAALTLEGVSKSYGDFHAVPLAILQHLSGEPVTLRQTIPHDRHSALRGLRGTPTRFDDAVHVQRP